MEAIRYLTDEERIRLLARAESRSYAKDDVVLAEGAYNEDIYILTGGSARVEVAGTAIGHIAVGEAFGEMSLLDGLPRSATVKAEEPTTTFALTSWQFLPLLDEYPSISRALLVELCARLRRVEHDPVQ